MEDIRVTIDVPQGDGTFRHVIALVPEDNKMHATLLAFAEQIETQYLENLLKLDN